MTTPYSQLTRRFTGEDRRIIAKMGERLEVRVKIAEAIGEELLRENDELAGLLCEAELDFSDKDLVRAIERQVAVVAGSARDFTPAQRRRIEELTDEVRGWIALAESGRARAGG